MSEVVDGSKEAPQAFGFLLGDVEDVETVLNEVPHTCSLLLLLLLGGAGGGKGRREEKWEEGRKGGREGREGGMKGGGSEACFAHFLIIILHYSHLCVAQ